MSNGQRSSREGGAEPINSFDLRCDIQFNTRVTSAVYDNTTNHWMTQTEQGEQIAAHYCITAVGCLSTPNIPAFKGPETFTGQVYHTSRWPHEGVDFSDKRVGVIGTGSTGIQAIPRIAKQAEHVTVFQRTPNYSIPAHNRPLTAEEKASVKANYSTLRQSDRESAAGFTLTRNTQSALKVTAEERQQKFEQGWESDGFQMLATFSDTSINLQSNTYMADFVRSKIGEMVHTPDIARLLMPLFDQGVSNEYQTSCRSRACFHARYVSHPESFRRNIAADPRHVQRDERANTRGNP